jgi:formylglycine-generating enzyme required for sulfatase activity
MTVRTRDASTGMTWVPGGSFLMGSEEFYPEERPVRRVEVDGFRMDDHPVTVTEFRRFAAATGYVTVAERALTGVRLVRGVASSAPSGPAAATRAAIRARGARPARSAPPPGRVPGRRQYLHRGDARGLRRGHHGE